MARNFRHPRLIEPDAREYLDFCSRHAATNRLLRIGVGRANQASSRAGAAFEEIIRAGLSQSGGLSDERILAFEAAKLGRGYVPRYREIDAVSIRSDTRLFEIKSSYHLEGTLSGIRQLHKTAAILRSGTIGTVRPLILLLIWIDTGVERKPGSGDWKNVCNLGELHALVRAPLAADQPHIYRITADTVWKWSGSLGPAFRG